jgi:3-oxoacyl-[acyl-carrier protein] reductase
VHPDLVQDFSLEGRTAVIAGGASGIGRETARVLAQAGAKVMLADVNEGGLTEAAGLVTQLGGLAATRTVDVSKKAEIDALADAAVRELGRVDIWVNAAGILGAGMIMEVEEDQFDKVFGVNLKGVYWGIAAAGRVMRGQGRGSIISISSGAIDSPIPNLSLYAMTKAAVAMVTRTAGKEFAEYGIRVNAIAPGWIETPLVAYHYKDEAGEIDEKRRQAFVDNMAKTIPLGITGKPRDIALAALYLAADASRFVTGQMMRPNGGVAMP